jgi:hypothetical protein
MNRNQLIIFGTVALMLLASAQIGFAQTTGTITVSGTDPDAFSITNTANAQLSATVILGNLNPATGGALTSGTTQIRLRSNKVYQLTAQATALNFTGAGNDDGGNPIALTDFGFGISSIDATAANVANHNGHTVVALYDYDPRTVVVANGLTPFVAATHGTLNDISAGAQILSGPRISTQGNISTDNNFILATLVVATLPQYFTPNASFSTTITLTIATQ